MRFLLNKKLIIILIFWLMFWLGYNTYPRKLDFSNFLNFFQGIRAFFPILAGFLALIILFFGKSFFSQKIGKNPLALLGVYVLVGIISSIFLSLQPLIALYWALAYGALIVGLWAILKSSQAKFYLSFLIHFNWLIISFIVFGWFLYYLAGGGELSFNFPRPFEVLAGAKETILGMATTRPTGFGRYLGILGLVTLAGLLREKRKIKFLWFFFFLLFYLLLLFSQAKTAIFGFIFGAFLIFLLKSQSKTAIFSWSLFTLVQLILVGIFLFYLPQLPKILTSPPPLLMELPPSPSAGEEKIIIPPELSLPPSKGSFSDLKEKIFQPLLTLGGRIQGIWPEAFNLFLRSPLIGFGFQADRIFLKGQHTHNALLQALVQTGLIGTLFFLSAFLWSGFILFKLLKKSTKEKSFLIEIAALFLFFGLRAITESTAAFFGADWILLAPLLGYIIILDKEKE